MRIRLTIVEDNDVREDEEGFVASIPIPRGGVDSGALARLVAALAPADCAGYRDRIVVKNGGRLILVRTRDIEWIEAEGNYALIHSGGESHLVRETIANLEGQLDPAHFRRIHRSTIVNVDRIREIRPQAHGDARVILETGAQLTLSRGYRGGLLGLFGPSL